MQEKLSTKLIVLAVGAILALILGFLIAQTGAWGAIALAPIFLGSFVLGYFIFKNPLIGFLLIIFFLPFERVPTLDFAGVNIKINTILGFLTIFAWLCAILSNPKKCPPARRLEASADWRAGQIQPNALAWPIGLFVIALLLSLTSALNLGRGMEVLFFSLFTIALSLMTVNMVTDKSALEKTVLALFISAGCVGLFGLFQFGGDLIGLSRSLTQIKSGYGTQTFGFPRIMAFSMEPLYFANYLLIPLSLAVAYFFGHAPIAKRYYLVALMVLLLVNFVLTVSRGGYLGLGATLLVLLIFYVRQIFTRKTVVILLVFLAVAGGVIFALSQGESRATQAFINQATLQDAKQSSDSIHGRLNSFDLAYKAFQRNPALGIGLGNYGPYAKYYPATEPETGWPIVNNEFIEILAETGLAGAVGFGLILLVILYRSLVALKYTHEPFLRASLIGLLAAFVGVMVQYNFFSTLYIIHIWILIGLLVAVQNIILQNSKYEIRNSKQIQNSNN